MTTASAQSPPIRLVAIDLDGTLLTDDKRIGQASIEAIARARAAGVKVMIASARPPRSVRPFYSLLGLDTLQINYNGALIWDESERKPFFHRPMLPELVHRIALRSRAMFDHVLVSCEILDRWYTDRFDQTYTTETGRLFPPDVVAPLAIFLNQPITKLMLLCDEPTVLQLEALLAAEFSQHISAVRCDAHLIQIMDIAASKAVALRRVAEHYGIAMEQVLAIGDAANDIPMLQAAGVAVTVANAPAAVKQVAHWTAPSNNADGVAFAMERYCNGRSGQAW